MFLFVIDFWKSYYKNEVKIVVFIGIIKYNFKMCKVYNF